MPDPDMSFECASCIVVAHGNLMALIDKAEDENASDAIKSYLNGKSDWLDPYIPQANRIKIAHTDSEFQAEAKKLKTQTDKVAAAVADFKKIDEALTAVGELITKIVKLLGAAGL